MYKLVIGVGHATINLRHCRSRKDKRGILKRLKEKLKHKGFSVTECDHKDNHQMGSLGFCYSANAASEVEKSLEIATRLFNEVEIIRLDKDIFDYSFQKGEGEFVDPEVV